jgi:hypothetical protein
VVLRELGVSGVCAEARATVWEGRFTVRIVGDVWGTDLGSEGVVRGGG